MTQAIANAQNGNYYTARNPTPGTAIAFAVSAAVSETAGYFLVLKNNDSPSATAAKRLTLDYIRLVCGTAPASGTAGYFFWKMDNVARWTSGGTALVANNVNMDSTNASIAQVWTGALTTAAVGASARCLAGGVFRTAIPVVGDEYIFKFGGDEMPGYSLLGGTATERIMIPCPPSIIGAQQSGCLQLWFPSNASTASQFEVELGWYESR